MQLSMGTQSIKAQLPQFSRSWHVSAIRISHYLFFRSPGLLLPSAPYSSVSGGQLHSPHPASLFIPHAETSV